MNTSSINYIKKINFENDLKILKLFFESNCGSSVDSFTYFKKRSYEVIKNHFATFLLMVDDHPIGYSHLDIDGKNVWFGICIAEKYKGQGFGKKLILATLEEATKNNIKPVLLSVYKDNIPAIELYKKVGFKTYKENDISYFMKKD